MRKLYLTWNLHQILVFEHNQHKPKTHADFEHAADLYSADDSWMLELVPYRLRLGPLLSGLIP